MTPGKEVIVDRPFRLVMADDTQVRRRPAVTYCLLCSVYPFMTTKLSPEDWARRVRLSDRSQLSDFGLTPEQNAEILIKYGVVADSNIYIWKLTELIAADVE